MRQVLIRNCLVATAVGLLIGAPAVLVGVQAPAGSTVFEGARLIVGDGQPPIENGAFVVTGARIVSVGRAADLKAPPGAARVNPWPARRSCRRSSTPTRTSVAPARCLPIADLKQRAYYGVGAALSLGQDADDACFDPD